MRRRFWLVLAMPLTLLAFALPGAAETDASAITFDLSNSGKNTFTQGEFLEFAKSQQVPWTDDGTQILIGSWNKTEGFWASGGELASALDQRNRCLDEKLPGRMAPFAADLMADGSLSGAPGEAIEQLEFECDNAAGLSFSFQRSWEREYTIPDDQPSFFYVADLGLGEDCIPIVADGSQSFCNKFYLAADPIFIEFEIDEEPFVSPLPQLFEFSPAEIGVTVVGASVLVLLVGLPSQLVGSALENAWPAITRTRFAQSLDRFRPKRRLPVPLTFGATLLAAALLSSIAELPRVEGAHEWAAAALIWLLAFGVITGIGLTALYLVSKRALSLSPVFEFHPSSLALLALTAILSLLIGFSPPVIFGLVLGLTFGLTFRSYPEGKLVAAGALYVLTAGIGSWSIYSIFDSQLGGESFVAQVLSAIAIASISGLPISLLPLGLLDGLKIIQWNRWAQPALWIASVATFILLASNPGEPIWQRVENLWLWATAYCLFVVAAVAAWLYLKRIVAKSDLDNEMLKDVLAKPASHNHLFDGNNFS